MSFLLKNFSFFIPKTVKQINKCRQNKQASNQQRHAQGIDCFFLPRIAHQR